MRESVRDWLREILISGVPVQTGAAKSALRPLGQFLRVAVPISPTRKPYFSRTEGGMMDTSLGPERTSFVLKDKNFDYRFEWTTEILHFWLSAFYNGSATPGEHAVEVANDIFLTQLEERILHRLPQYADFITLVPG